MSGKMQRAIFSISRCGMPELLMNLLRLPKIVLLRTPLVDSEGVLGVFEMEKRRYRIKYLRGVLAVFRCNGIVTETIVCVKSSRQHGAHRPV